MIGRLLGPYRIVERLGAGGMGVVYRARDERLERDVALKVLPEGTLADAVLRESLHREAVALSRTNHPHIATVFHFDRQDQVDFLVMEYVPGPTLAERIARGPLEEAEVVRLGLQLADGLAAAHAQGVVHRDLKPSNLKLTAEGRLKILDFGIARLLPRADDRTVPESDRGRGAGSLPYMAPELLRGGRADARSDIYAVGAVLYELVTGRRPFRADHDVALIQAIASQAPEPPSRYNPTVSPALEQIILKALEKDPDCRYQSAPDLRADFERLARSTARIAVPSGPAPAGFGRRGSRRLVEAGVLTAVLIAGLIVLRPALRRPAPAPTAEPTRTRLAVLAPLVPSGSHSPDDWPALLQSLVAGELTGVQGLGVVDPLSLNGLLENALGSATPPRGSELLRQLRRADVTLALDASLLEAGPSYQVRWNLFDVQTGELSFTYGVLVKEEADLARGARELATRLLTFLQLRGLNPEQDRDLAPWLALRKQNPEALKAFVQASQFMYRYEPGGEKYLRRAIELDPTFIAPRVWLVVVLAADNRLDEARQHLAELSTLESQASPFEQAMIGFAGAFVQQDLAGQARYLDIALTYSPGNHILLVNLAGVYLVSGNCERALEVLDPLVAVQWAYPPTYTMRGWCGIDTGRFEPTRTDLERALRKVRVEPVVYGLLELLALATEDPSAAAHYGAEFDRHPIPSPAPVDLVQAYRRAAHILRERGRERAAAAVDDRARTRFWKGPQPAIR